MSSTSIGSRTPILSGFSSWCVIGSTCRCSVLRHCSILLRSIHLSTSFMESSQYSATIIVLHEPARPWLMLSPMLSQITQMKFRLSEGRGECFYYIGRSITPCFVTVRFQTLTHRHDTCVHVDIQPASPTEPGAVLAPTFTNPMRYHLLHRVAGVEDDGYPRGLNDADLEGSLATVRLMAKPLGATAEPLEYFQVSNTSCSTPWACHDDSGAAFVQHAIHHSCSMPSIIAAI
jgi:hypothetical protein